MPRVIAVDMDGTLCKDVCWTSQECLDAEPNQRLIDKVNRLAETEFILIYTARRYNLCEATLKWLDKHLVRYNAISFRKANADLYIDDKMINWQDWIEDPYP